MNDRIRIALLCGCGLIATLTAPPAAALLTQGLSGPYAEPGGRPHRPADSAAKAPADVGAGGAGIAASLR